MRSDSRIVLRRSGVRPSGPDRVRRVRRRGGVSLILLMILRSAASLTGRAGSERALLQRLHVRGHQAEHRLLRLGSLRGPARSPASRMRPRPGRRRLPPAPAGAPIAAVLAQEERPEDPIVGNDVVRSADQCRAPGPVEVDEIGRIEQPSRGAVRQHVTGADRQPGRPQRAGESSQDAGEVRPGQAPEVSSARWSRTRSRSSRSLMHRAEGVGRGLRREVLLAEELQRRAPSRSSRPRLAA